MPTPSARPNVLWFFTDQWRAQATGYAGDPNARTPHLDRFARESVNFTHALSNHPLCVPYRACLLTGLHQHANRVVKFDDSLPADQPTIGHWMERAGYQTAYIGKWHLGDHANPDVNPANDKPRNESTLMASRIVPPDRRGGFHYWEAFEAGNLVNDPILHGDRFPQPTQIPGYQSDVLVDSTLHYLDHAARPDRPWFLTVSVEPPHPPLDWPAADIAPYAPENIQLSPNVPCGGEAERRARQRLSGYYAHIEATDRAFGRLLAGLDARGLRENTLVVFFSDHGDMMGSHGWNGKILPHEESVRIPMLMRWPGHLAAGGTTDALLGDIDMAPTLLGLIGQTPPATLHGRDLSACALHGAPGPEAALLSINAPPPWYDQFPYPWRAVRTRDAKLAVSAGGPAFLYDLAADPHEQRNLIADPAHAALRERLHATLAAELARVGDPFVI